jgi:hypothetical protein
MATIVDPRYLKWQRKSIPASSDLRGVWFMGLLAAWFFFLWQALSLPPFAASTSSFGPLLRSTIDKGQFMPDFGAIVAGFVVFHVRREFGTSFAVRTARRVIALAVLALLVPLAVVFALQQVEQGLGGGAYGAPWRDLFMHIQLRVVLSAAVFAVLLPPLLFYLWTATPDVSWAAVALCLIFYGITFHLHTYRLEWAWTARAVVGLGIGMALCSTLYRAAQYLVAVRGTVIIIGILALLGGAILPGPGMFFLGFLMTVSGLSLSERTSRLPGEAELLLWSRTAYAVFLVQGVVLTAWSIWGRNAAASPVVVLAGLAVAIQFLAIVLRLAVEIPLWRALRRMIPAPLK